MTTTTRPDPRAVLQLPEFRSLMAANAASTLASRALAVVIGYQIYQLTHDPLALGWLGLVEAIPAISLALFGGHVADRVDRRGILLVTMGVSVACATAFAVVSTREPALGPLPLYAIVFVAGIARGFADPASGAFDAQLVPREQLVTASAWLSSVWQGGAIIGPALGGVAYAALHATGTYAAIAVLFATSWLCIARIRPRPHPDVPEGESMLESIAVGVRYVFSSQALVGSMALDLFAVLFGGAIALLPAFATDVLHAGPAGLGVLSAAPSAGALLVMLWATRHPPVRNAGRNLMLSVAGFGVCMIVFALSRSLALSAVALAFSGAFDGVSMVIRRSILRLLSPEHMRGRIAAVSSIFIGSSNEIGAFESGVTAKLLGVVRSVWVGGIFTFVVVAATAILAPKLRNLHLDEARPDA